MPVALVTPSLALDVVSKSSTLDKGIILFKSCVLSNTRQNRIGSVNKSRAILSKLIISDSSSKHVASAPPGRSLGHAEGSNCERDCQS